MSFVSEKGSQMVGREILPQSILQRFLLSRPRREPVRQNSEGRYHAGYLLRPAASLRNSGNNRLMPAIWGAANGVYARSMSSGADWASKDSMFVSQ